MDEEEAIEAEHVKHSKLEDVLPDDHGLVLLFTVLIISLVTDHLASWPSICVSECYLEDGPVATERKHNGVTAAGD